MTNLRFRYAEWEHILEQSAQRDLNKLDPHSSASTELFDTLDSMSIEELCELVAIFYYGLDASIAGFQAARAKAAKVTFSGVEILHNSRNLHLLLNQGLERLSKESSVLWFLNEDE